MSKVVDSESLEPDGSTVASASWSRALVVPCVTGSVLAICSVLPKVAVGVGRGFMHVIWERASPVLEVSVRGSLHTGHCSPGNPWVTTVMQD